MTDPDPFRLSRFVDAQAGTYATALAELRAGEKRSHWMWYVFPQLRGLGLSPTASFYGIASLDEARACLGHPVLGPRLAEATEAVLAHAGRPLSAIFGAPDDMKFASSMTLFERAAASFEALRREVPRDEEPGASPAPFARALDLLVGGARDPRTLALLQRAAGGIPAR